MPQSLKQATKKSIYENNVKKLDSLGSEQSEFDTKLNVIEQVLGQFIERVKDNIDKEKNFVVTGKISNMSLQADGDGVNVLGNPWLIYQDRGVNGAVTKLYDTPHSYTDKMPPVDVFIEWIKTKKIQLRDNEKYSYKKPPFKELDSDEKIKRAAWGMAKKVYQEGFKPRKIYSREIPKLVDDLKQQLTGFAIQQVVQNINVKDSAKRIIVKA